ncbi:MAG: hypothetical protein OHK0022_31110 [Roseiflexaceae bacterium]
MPTLVPIVEGHGEVEAVQVLLRAIFVRMELWDWQVAKPNRIGGLGKLRKELPNLLWRLVAAPPCDAILVLNDCDDGCPVEEARFLARIARSAAIPCPVAITLACREYEAWFLASLSTIAGNCNLPADLVYPGDVEGRRDVKGWLSDQMPQGVIYKETEHQVRMTSHLDIEQALARSRSFQRLCHAVDELVQAAGTGQRGFVTPLG